MIDIHLQGHMESDENIPEFIVIYNVLKTSSSEAIIIESIFVFHKSLESVWAFYSEDKMIASSYSQSIGSSKLEKKIIHKRDAKWSLLEFLTSDKA